MDGRGCVARVGVRPGRCDVEVRDFRREEGGQVCKEIDQYGVAVGRGVSREADGQDLGRVAVSDAYIGPVEDFGCGRPQQRVTSEEAGGVEFGCERHDTVERDQTMRWSVTVKALDLRRTTNTATGVRANGKVEPVV